MKEVTCVLSYRKYPMDIRFILITAGFWVVLFFTSLFLFFASSNAPFLTGSGGLFNSREELTPPQSAAANGSFEAGGCTLSLPQIAPVGEYLKVTILAENTSEKELSLSDTQFNLKGLSLTAPFRQQTFSSAFHWSQTIPAEGALEISLFFKTQAEFSSFSFDYLDKSGRALGQFLINFGDIV